MIGPAEGEALRRLRTLAAIGACAAHEWYFDAALNIDEVPPNGHVNDGSSEFGFDTCAHPDCVLVRAPLSGPVDASGEPMVPAEEIERMKRDAHFDPLRERLRGQVRTLREIADGINRYLSSPAQCSVEAASKFRHRT